MSQKLNRYMRWMMLIGSGAVMLQAVGCQYTEALQTTLLAILTGTVVYLARNV